MTLKKLLSQKDVIWAIGHRRHLHMFPEISFEEENTSLYCQGILKKLGLEVKVIWKHGFIADLKVKGAKKTIAWRTELDALLMCEKNTCSYSSKNNGVAHMCGHDMHMAIALLGAKVLSENRDELKCNVRFIFQPAEECPPGGAVEMIAHGCLENVDEIYCLHNDILNDTGTVTARVGTMTAHVGLFDIAVEGKGGHVALPKYVLDPIKASCDLIMKWYNDIDKLKSSLSPFTFRVSSFLSGQTFNVIPEEARFCGSIRTTDEKDFDEIERKMREPFTSFEKEGFKIIFNCKKSYGATINLEEGVEKVFSAAEAVVGKEKTKRYFEPAFCGEDFSYYLQKRLGAFFYLGAKNLSKKIFEPQHSPRFDVDEDAIAVGAAIMIQLMQNM